MNTVRVAAGVIKRNEQYFVCKRDAAQHQGGKWEFPGGKIEANETPAEALCRELEEEVGIQVNSPQLITEIKHTYTDKAVHLYFFMVEDFVGSPSSKEGLQSNWFSLDNLKTLTFPDANTPILSLLDSQ